MKCFALAFALALSLLSTHAASFPYVRLGGTTNQLSDSGTNLTYNGSAITTVTTNFVQKTGDTMSGGLQINTTLSLTNDVILLRDAANTLALRNGANAQALRVYSTYTDASNYERGSLGYTAGDLWLQHQWAGTGTGRNLVLYAPSGILFDSGNTPTTRFTLSSTGHLLAFTDNTYDIGASGANRPRNVYVATSILLGTNVLSFSGTNLTWNGTAITVP